MDLIVRHLILCSYFSIIFFLQYPKLAFYAWTVGIASLGSDQFDRDLI